MSSLTETTRQTEEVQRHHRGSFADQKNGIRSLSDDADDVDNLNGQTKKSSSPPPAHRRGYQACDPCRKRKVKCDLGSVDNPRPPPCVRCRRESKRCEFSATRRKRKTSDADTDAEGALRRDKRMMVGEANHTKSSPGSDSPYQRNSSISFDGDHSSRTTQWPGTSPPLAHTARPSTTIASFPPSSGAGSAGQYAELGNIGNSAVHARMHTRLTGSGFHESSQQVINKAAAELLSPSISNTNDALHLLSEAAGRTEDLNRQSLENRRLIARRAASFHTPPTPLAATSRNGRPSFLKPSRSTPSDPYFHANGAAVVDPHLSDIQDSGYLDAVKAWSRLRFVRAGWLTVEEAMAYIDYYYEHLAPLSPIVIPDFSPPSTHRTLLTEEPVLAVTMLTTASRYMRPKGDGAQTRAFYIHDRLWSYLRGMIERMFWGQEKFGGNPMGPGNPGSIDVPSLQGKANPSGHLRSLGTIEALLILTDWHPRNLHFPPGDDENTLLDADAHAPSHLRSDKDGDNDLDIGTNRSQCHHPEGRLAFQSWLEPTWRSDRMSWMLLSTAQALAFELGVFDQKNSGSSHLESAAEQVRKRRVRRLILVYVTQSSGRLGIPSMLPLPQWSNDIEPRPLGDALTGDVTIDRMQDCWISISQIMYQSNQLLFSSKEQTSDLIRTGQYRERIADFLPLLRDFRRKFDSLSLSPQMRMILTIEYEYTRVYVNCLALQAVVDRWTTINNDSNTTQASGARGSTSLRVLMELYRVNETYIQEVVDASRNILKTVLEGLLPGDHLKHCPVRTYFRVLSGMIFILKTFTLGATEDDVRVSLDLQDRTIEALRTCVVDDVHLGNTISRLLELLTTNIRTRFLRFAPTDRACDGDSHDRTSAPNSRAASPRPREKGVSRREQSEGNPWPQSHSSTPFHHQQNGHGHMGYSLDGSGNGNQPSTTMGGYYDPLAHIPAQPINSSNINVAFMPPPPSVYYNYYDHNTTPPTTTSTTDDTNPPVTAAHSVNDTGAASSSSGGALPPDWFALPLDQFFNSSTAGVEQGLGGTGPMVGEFDMLEVLLNEQFDRDDGIGGGNTNGDGSSHFIGV